MNIKLFTNLKAMQALLFLLIPLTLTTASGETLDSISAYAYRVPMLFAFLLTLSGAVFFYDGFVEPKRWYNVLSGVFLWGVVLFPHLDYSITHYAFAGCFFLWSAFNMVYFSSKKERALKIVAAGLIVLGIVVHYAFNSYSLFVAEWVGMLPISVHYTLEVLEKID